MPGKKIKILSIVCGLVMMSTSVFAQPYTGVAFIVNNDVKKAEQDAVNDAKRQCVEQEVGTMINAQTEVANLEVISDRITATSQGCVLTKKVISRKRKGEVFEVVLDLQANRDTIAMTAQQIKDQIANAVGTSRSGIDIAVINGDDLSDDAVGDMITQKLRIYGYKTQGNDQIDEYLISAEKMNPPPSNREIRLRLRQFGKTSGPNAANCLIRGKITTEPAEKLANGMYKVTAYFNGQIIGYTSNIIDAVDHYAIAVGDNPNTVKKDAQYKAALEAAEILAQQTAETLQREGVVW